MTVKIKQKKNVLLHKVKSNPCKYFKPDLPTYNITKINARISVKDMN